MSNLRTFGVAATAFAGLMTLGAIRWSVAVPPPEYQRIHIGAIAIASTDSLDEILAESEELVVSNDPFRLANTPASVRFNETSDNTNPAAIAPPSTPRPNLTLKAIVGGPPWQAVVDGIPGQPQNTLVRSGAAFDRLVVRAVTRDSVIMQGPDSIWVLSFRRPP